MKFELEKLEVFLQDYAEQKKVPGMAVCVNGPEGTIYKKGFGYRDVEKTQPVDAQTIFGIGSVSKSITCACLAILESEGKLSYRDPVYKYIPELRVPGTPREALLIHHLANMTSGIPPLPTLMMSMVCHTKFGAWVDPGVAELGRRMIQVPMATVGQIVDYISTNDDYEVLGAPGEYMSYCNDGYAMLSTIVDIASGSTLEQFAHDRIFAPLGMTRTTFDIDEAKAMGNITSLFIIVNEQLYSSDDWDEAPPYRGAGFVKSTAEDMSKFYEMLACDGLLRGKRILPEGCVARICGNAFPETPEITYCYGLMKHVFQDTVIVEHGGSLTGLSASCGCFKNQGYAATILTNLGGITSTLPLNAIYNMLLGLPLETSHAPSSPQGEKPENPKMYVGTYVSLEAVPQIEVEISLDDAGDLCMKEMENEGKLLFCDTTVFAFADGKTPINQSRTIRFFIRNGKAWGLHSGFRMLQRDD